MGLRITLLLLLKLTEFGVAKEKGLRSPYLALLALSLLLYKV